MSGVSGTWALAAAQHALTGEVGMLGTQAVLAGGGGGGGGGGVKPEDASPGIGAFITFILLAGIIILLAWSFTRHQRKIRARAALEEQWRSAARKEAAEGAADDEAAQEAPRSPGEGSDEPGSEESGGRPPQPGAGED